MTIWGKYRSIALLAAGLAVALLISWDSPSRLDTLVAMAASCVMAVSLALVYGQAGILSLATAGFASIGAYATAIATVNYKLPIGIGFVLAVVAPAVAGYVLSRLVVRLSHLALAVATLVLSEVLGYAISSGGHFTGGYVGIAGIPRWQPMAHLQGAAVVGSLLVLGATLILLRVIRSQQGRALRVIAADRLLAESLGIDVAGRVSWLFALSAGMAGVAGWYYAHTRYFISPDALSVDLSLTVLFIVIVGGRATVLGPVVGTLLLTQMSNFLPDAALRGMLYAAALIAVLLVFPHGLLGTDWVRLARRAGGAFPRRAMAATAPPGDPA